MFREVVKKCDGRCRQGEVKKSRRRLRLLKSLVMAVLRGDSGDDGGEGEGDDENGAPSQRAL